MVSEFIACQFRMVSELFKPLTIITRARINGAIVEIVASAKLVIIAS